MDRFINTVNNMDCIKMMGELPDKSIDLAICDPPYYRMRGEFDFVFKDEEEYIEWTKAWVAEVFRVLKDTGAIYVYGSALTIDKVSVLVLNEFDWIKRNLIVWNYRTGRPSKTTFRIETEYIWLYSKEGHRINTDDVRIPYTSGGYEKDKRKNPLGKSLGNVWEVPRIMKNYPEWVDHPTQKPLALCDNIVKASSKEGDVVLIPFGGSGSEVISCIKNNRNYIASEIKDEYFELIIKRIENNKKSL